MFLLRREISAGKTLPLVHGSVADLAFQEKGSGRNNPNNTRTGYQGVSSKLAIRKLTVLGVIPQKYHWKSAQRRVRLAREVVNHRASRGSIKLCLFLRHFFGLYRRPCCLLPPSPKPLSPIRRRSPAPSVPAARRVTLARRARPIRRISRFPPWPAPSRICRCG